jgi:hypothetical protein
VNPPGAAGCRWHAVGCAASAGAVALGRHWLLRTSRARPPEAIACPFPVPGVPTALGYCARYTTEESEAHV